MQESCPFEITPFAQSQPGGKQNIFNLNYTNQDFWSMKSRLTDFIKEKFGKEFNDFVESDIAIMLIENWAFLADTLSFKIDQIANEIFIDTVTELENAFRLAKLVGFHPQPPIAARSMWTARLNNPVLVDLEIPAPLDLDVTFGDETMTIELMPADANNNPIFDRNITIPAGQIVNSSIVGLEGFTYTDRFQGNGQSQQTFLLSTFPVLYDSTRVDVDGVRWTQVDFFSDSQPRREYRLEFDSLYRAFVIFGNNRAGLIPPNGAQIVVKFRQGGGTKGNIVTGFAQTETVVPVEGFQFSVPVSLSNYTRGEFGYDGDTIEDIRRNLPIWIKTQDRAVSGNDYKAVADLFTTPYHGKTGKATAALRNMGCASNIVDIYVLVQDGVNGLQEPNPDFTAALQEEYENKKMFNTEVCIKHGFIVNVDVDIDVVMDKFYKKFEDEFRERVQRRLGKFFALVNWDYGKTLRDIDIIKEMSDIREIKRFEITLTTNEEDNSGQMVTAKYNEIIRSDVIQLNFMYD